MAPHPIIIERMCQDRLDQFTAEVNHLRLVREAKAGRREAPSQTGSSRTQGGLQSILAAMTRLWNPVAG
ncbi:MAG TPA: hypothetical protein VFE42_37070 [Chloroflexota bacterium]|nr:hypothetical protein [Chloroflexota bacterium]